MFDKLWVLKIVAAYLGIVVPSKATKATWLKAVLTCKDFKEVKNSVLDDHGDPELFLLTL